jgi:hypothetical protein
VAVHHLAKRAAALLPLAVVLACGRARAPIERGSAADGNQDVAALAASPGLAPIAAQASVSRPAATPRLRPYPHGSWRLARPALKDVVLWVSHLLIRYEHVTTEVSFCQAGWQGLPAPARTRSDALALARSIAEQARSRPENFAELARVHSEDPMTRERGGSLGGVWALHLSSWPDVLDALTVVRPGEVSDVVETEYGFHVLYRSVPPPEQVVSGARIVIGHEQAPFLAQLRGAPLPVRERGQALALANEVYAQASARPDRFQELVARYSEHPDAALAGDLGQWSTREPTEYPTQIETLSGLAVGEIAKPLETLFGWEILLRTANRERPVYAMTPLEVSASVEASASGVEERTASGELPLQRALQLAQMLREQPERFDELQRKNCCNYVVQWPEGRGWPPLLRVLQSMQPGQIAAEPIRLGPSYVIPKRVPARPEAPRQTRFDLPSPSEPDLGYVFTSLPTKVIAQQLAVLGERVRVELQLPPEAFDRLQQIHEAACTSDAPDPDAPAALAEVQRRGLELLGERGLARYLQLMKEQFKGYLLGPS